MATDYHRRGRLPVCVTPALPSTATEPTTPAATHPERPARQARRQRGPFRVWAAESRYGNINPFVHSTTPVGLALGPDSPGDDERGPGTLGHPARGIPTPVSLLMSAFSLPNGPRRITPPLRPRTERSPTQPPKEGCRVFGGVLEPRYIVGAEPLDQ